MKSFSKNQKQSFFKRRPNFLIMAVAVIVAATLWYFVRMHERLEAQIEVNIDYTGIPPNLIVTSGLESKMTVRVRAPEILLRSIPREKLNTSINLSNIKKGETIVPLGKAELGPKLRAFDVVDIQPPRIVVKADNLVEKSLPIRTIEESSPLTDSLTVENMAAHPGTVIVKGPESVISGMTSIALPIRLDPNTAGIRQKQTLTLDTPGMVTANPSSVDVTYTITSGRTALSRDCAIKIAGNSGHTYEVVPNVIQLSVEVPEALSKNSSYLKQLEASIVPPPMQVGKSQKIRVRISLPEGMKLLNQSLQEATITKLKD